jgi:hypothetical protein
MFIDNVSWVGFLRHKMGSRTSQSKACLSRSRRRQNKRRKHARSLTNTNGDRRIRRISVGRTTTRRRTTTLTSMPASTKTVQSITDAPLLGTTPRVGSTPGGARGAADTKGEAKDAAGEAKEAAEEAQEEKAGEAQEAGREAEEAEGGAQKGEAEGEAEGEAKEAKEAEGEAKEAKGEAKEAKEAQENGKKDKASTGMYKDNAVHTTKSRRVEWGYLRLRVNHNRARTRVILAPTHL